MAQNLTWISLGGGRQGTNTDVHGKRLNAHGVGGTTAGVGQAQVCGSASAYAWDKPTGRLLWSLILTTSTKTERVDR